MSGLIELQNVTNRFGSQVVHDGVSLMLEENETLGLVGGSGSGKSVLLRTMLGLNKPKSSCCEGPRWPVVRRSPVR